MAYNSYRKTSDFDDRVLGPTVEFLEKQKEDPSLPQGVDLKLVMINTLQQADRLAIEALQSLRSNYEDSAWLTVGLGMIAYVLAMFGIEGAYHLLTGNQYLLWSSLVGASAAVAGSVWYFRRTYQLRSGNVRHQVNDIRAAIAREQGTMPASEDDEPALGLILRLWPEMPAWARYRRSSFYQRNPVTSIVVAGLLVGTFQFGLLGILGGLVALGLAACSIALYLWTKAGNARDDGEMLEDWNRKVQTLASMIERKLEEL